MKGWTGRKGGIGRKGGTAGTLAAILPILPVPPVLPVLPAYCLVITTEKEPLLSLISLSLTPSIRRPLAGIRTGAEFVPMPNGALLPTFPINVPAFSAAIG